MSILESTTSATEALSAASTIPIREPGEEAGPIKWKGKEKATVVDEIDDREIMRAYGPNAPVVDWTQYEPPDGLKKTPDLTPDIIVRIIQESIDNVKARITQEKEKRKAEGQAEESRQSEELRKESEDVQIVGTSDTPFDENPGEWDALPEMLPPAITEMVINTPSLPSPVQPVKPKMNSLKNLFRRLNNTGEKGESSSAGAARHKRDFSRSSAESSTTKRFVAEVLKRTTTNSSGSTNSSVRELEVECVSCLDDFNPWEMVKAPCHSYCKSCFANLIRTTCENEQQWPPKCCLNPIPVNTIILNVNAELKRTYRNRAAEWNLPVSERVYCSSRSCSIWLQPDQINRARNIGRCSAGHWTCIICRGGQHDGDKCPQDRDMVKTDELAEEEGWKRCYGCHAYVEHREACQHMTCRCGAQFCYVCGARWRTCVCTMEQLRVVKRQAETRRQARQDREAVEEAEIQEALRLVEEFEREEALKAKLLRQERERLAEERRERLLEERIRREGERRRDVEVKYAALREALVRVNGYHRLTVSYGHLVECLRLEKQIYAALGDFIEGLKADRRKFEAAGCAKLVEREQALEREYTSRAMEERRIEEGYRDQLQAYWSGKPDGEAKMEAAMKQLQRKMDACFKKWEEWRDNELDECRRNIEEQLDVKNELAKKAGDRFKEDIKAVVIAFVSRRTAEFRWVDVVIEERDRLLNDTEIDEIENGVDVDAWFEDGGIDGSELDDADFPQEFRVPGAYV